MNILEYLNQFQNDGDYFLDTNYYDEDNILFRYPFIHIFSSTLDFTCYSNIKNPEIKDDRNIFFSLKNIRIFKKYIQKEYPKLKLIIKNLNDTTI